MKAEKISRRKQQAAATREKLYLSAERLCQAHNFSDLSVDAIVEAAGVSKGTFYVHFESKDALLAALLADYVNRVDLDYQAYAASLPPHTPAAEKLLALIAKIADTLEHAIGRDKMAAVYQLHLSAGMDKTALMGYDRGLYQVFSSLLAEGLERGEFCSPLLPESLAQHCMLAIRGVAYEWCARGTDFDLRAQALAHFQLLLSALAAPKPLSGRPQY